MKKFFFKVFSPKIKSSPKSISFEEMSKSTKVLEIFKAISNFGKESEIRFVGGCVRKILNNERFDDIDLATNINPEQIKECLHNYNINFYETGIEHGTITATIDKKNFEITSLRKDIKTDGRHATVKFTNDWKEDADRRDFTINSIYADLEGNLFDPHNGFKDLENGIVKFIGDPEKRIKEDYLRILRYVRFFLSYSKQAHNPEIKKIIKQNISGILNLSKERLLDELKKLFLSNGFVKLNKDEFSQEILLLIFPQLKNIDIINKLSKYSESLIEKKDFIFLLSLMIIDETDNSDYFLYQFNVSNETKKRINFLKESYCKLQDKNTFSKKNLQKIFYFYGKLFLEDMIDFQLFITGKNNKKLIELKEYFKNLEKPKFPIKANIIMEKYKIKEGRELGQKLRYLENLWVENSFKITDKEIDKVFTI